MYTMKKATKFNWLLAVLVLSLTANFVFAVLTLAPIPEKQITGTYSILNPMTPTDANVYLAIAQDGTYTLYRQYELLEEGGFHLDNNSLYLKSGVGYYDKQDTIVLLSDGEINVFTRFSDIPTLINVP